MNYTKKSILISGQKALYFELNKSGEDAHFFAGNGLPAGIYEPFLHKLSKNYRLSSLAYRAMWSNAGARKSPVKLTTYANDLISFIEQKYDKPIVGIGHSQGAHATLVAAAKRPDLFSKIVLFEPISVTSFDQLWIGLLPFSLKKTQEPFKSALKKQAVWSSIESFYDYMRTKNGYRRISDENLFTVAKNSLEKQKDGTFKLLFPVDWEVANYALPVNLNKHFKKLSIPHKVVMGKTSLFIKENVRKQWAKIVKGEIVENNSYGHLIPLEAPDFCAEEVFNLK